VILPGDMKDLIARREKIASTGKLNIVLGPRAQDKGGLADRVVNLL